MKDIAITANTSWYIYNFRKNTILKLQSCGYKVLIIAPHDNYTPKLKNLGCKYINICIDKNGKNILNDFFTIVKFYLIFKKNDIKVVLNFTSKNNIYSTFAAYINGIKVINNISGLGANFTKKSFTSLIMKLLYKLSQPLANVIFFQNKEDMILFENNNIGLNIKKILIPGSGVDLKRFKFSNNNNPKKLNFLMSSRLIKEKGIYLYYEAAKYFKTKYKEKIEFNLIGFVDKNNPSSIDIEEIKLWKSSKIINYLGATDNIEEIIKNMDCIILPSYYSEGVPKSLLEGAAMGKPIITTNNVGCKEVVDHGFNGYLVEPRSLDSLIVGIKKFINLTKDERLKMGVKSRQKAEINFDEEIIINKYLVIIDSFFV